MTGLPSHFQLITSAIAFTKTNHKVISQNLANVNTPMYQAKQVSFEELLKHVESGSKDKPEFSIEKVEGLEVRNDGNNVDLDRELANLKKNAILHESLTQMLGSKISLMQSAISGQ